MDNTNAVGEEFFQKDVELLKKAHLALSKGGKVDILSDLYPEFKDLKGKSYCYLLPAGSLDRAERKLTSNLNCLLNSRAFEYIIVPLNYYSSKELFCYRYGLSKDRGSRISYDQFLSLINQGTVKIIHASSPKVLKGDYYDRISRQCEISGYSPPSYVRLNVLAMNLKILTLAQVEDISPEGDWFETILKLHPELNPKLVVKEFTPGLNIKTRKAIAKFFMMEDPSYVENFLATKMHSFRVLGLERLANLANRCFERDAFFGAFITYLYNKYLVNPLTIGLMGYSNYSLSDIEGMAFLRLIPRDLEWVWKDLLSESPLCSSVATKPLEYDYATLTGDELLNYIEKQPGDELQKNLLSLDQSLNSLDNSSVMQKFQRIDELISEQYQKEISKLKSYKRITQGAINIGRTFFSITEKLADLFTTIAVGSGKIEWLPFTAGAALASKEFSDRIRSIEPKDVVNSLVSRKLIFRGTGLPHILWKYGIDPVAREHTSESVMNTS